MKNSIALLMLATLSISSTALAQDHVLKAIKRIPSAPFETMMEKCEARSPAQAAPKHSAEWEEESAACQAKLDACEKLVDADAKYVGIENHCANLAAKYSCGARAATRTRQAKDDAFHCENRWTDQKEYIDGGCDG